MKTVTRDLSPMTGWLRCRLDSGMFSDEVAVTYPATDRQWQKSVFVPSSFVRSEGKHRGEVMVRVIEKDGAHYAVLPTPERDMVRVEGADLKQR